MYGFHKVTEHQFATSSPTSCTHSSRCYKFSSCEDSDENISAESPKDNINQKFSNVSDPTSVYSKEQSWEFRHPYFKRGEHHLMALIKRKPPKTSTNPCASVASNNDLCNADPNFFSYLTASLSAFSIPKYYRNEEYLVNSPTLPCDPLSLFESKLHALEEKINIRLSELEKESLEHQTLARNLAICISEVIALLKPFFKFPWISDLCDSIEPLLNDSKGSIYSHKHTTSGPFFSSRTSISSLLSPMGENGFSEIAGCDYSRKKFKPYFSPRSETLSPVSPMKRHRYF
ncbi:hypothetical protein HMI54_008136 [Coelomomyces lativittatus]|nr:hypothetical protein HMI54_008136 [Coelomomyces lativittatus]